MSYDARHRDNPPVFYISPQVAGFKYHALLMEPVTIQRNIVFDVYDEDRGKRVLDGETFVMITRGIYGFQIVEARDKFCRKCNAAADATEVKICIPVTVPGLAMEEPMVTTIRYQSATASVANEEGTKNV